MGTLPGAFVLLWVTVQWRQEPETYVCTEGIPCKKRHQVMGTGRGFNHVQMERVFSLQREPSFPLCPLVPAVYTSGLYPGEAVRFETGISIVEPLYPGMQREEAAHFVLGNVLGALQAQCQVHCHLGVARRSPHIHTPN